MIITNNPYKCKLSQSIYYKIIDSLDFNSICCNSCSSANWAFHASYNRYVDILNRCFKIKILRVICLTCGKTHAILVKDIVPFSILSFNDIISVLIHTDPDLVSSAHFFYLKYKYSEPFMFSYESFCLRNKRNCSLIFIST